MSLSTLRRWDQAGKFKARRARARSINGYRLYAKAEGLKLRKKIVNSPAA